MLPLKKIAGRRGLVGEVFGIPGLQNRETRAPDRHGWVRKDKGKDNCGSLVRYAGCGMTLHWGNGGRGRFDDGVCNHSPRTRAKMASTLPSWRA